MKRAIWASAVVVAFAAVAIPADAANPKEGAYAQYKGKGSQKKLVISLVVDKTKKNVMPSFYNDCAPVPVQYSVEVKNGKFSFHGSKKDVIDNEIDIDISGKFKTSKLATGTVRYESKGCDADPVKFKAKYQGKAG